MEQIRLMCVEVEMIRLITTGVIPNMSKKERSQLMTDLERINGYREETPECALDISKSFEDQFVEDDTVISAMLINKFKQVLLTTY